MDDMPVLKYEDFILRKSDLDILKSDSYLNDQIIGFYFSYLSSSLAASDDVLLILPTVSFWIANCPDTAGVKEAIDPLNLPAKKLVLFPVNNNDDFETPESGSHWSLLVYDRSKNAFFHFDSMKGMNEYHALKLYDALKGFVGTSEPSLATGDSSGSNKNKSFGEAIKSTAGSASLPIYRECKTPQQTNGHDCGLYVLAIANAVCEWHTGESENKGVDWLSAVDEHVDQSLEATMRRNVLKIIEKLKMNVKS